MDHHVWRQLILDGADQTDDVQMRIRFPLVVVNLS